MVIKNQLEPLVEPYSHDDSYGYRPGKSALDAIAQARQRCWRDDWVLDMDIKGFVDALDHSLVMKAVAKYSLRINSSSGKAILFCRPTAFRW